MASSCSHQLRITHPISTQKGCLASLIAVSVTQEEEEGLISIGGGSGGAVAAAAPAPVTAPAAAVDEGSSLLSHDEQEEAFFADPTANGSAPGSPVYADQCCLPLCPGLTASGNWSAVA